MEDMNIVTDIVGAALRRAVKYDLEVEVIASALIALKNDPTITIEQAVAEGIKEWDV